MHDPLGRRIAKKVDGVITEKYLWQGLTRLLAVYDVNNSLLMRFEYADARMPVAMTAGGAKYYLAYDQVGTLKAVFDSSGNVLLKREYDSFGNILNEEGTPPFEMPFGFAGGLYDKDTGLVRFGYRDYDPDTGRWTAKDPILFAGGDTDLYGYCLNDPVNLADPRGTEASPGADSDWWNEDVSPSDIPLSAGDVVGTIITVANEMARQTGRITSATAAGITVITAPVGDMVSPCETVDQETEELCIKSCNNPFFTPFYIKININGDTVCGCR